MPYTYSDAIHSNGKSSFSTKGQNIVLLRETRFNLVNTHHEGILTYNRSSFHTSKTRWGDPSARRRPSTPSAPATPPAPLKHSFPHPQSPIKGRRPLAPLRGIAALPQKRQPFSLEAPERRAARSDVPIREYRTARAVVQSIRNIEAGDAYVR